jgi:hypothetical protein
MPCDTHSQATTDFEFEKHCQPFVGADKENAERRDAHQQRGLFARGNCTGTPNS